MLLIQVIVCEIQNLQNWKHSKPSRKIVEPVKWDIEDSEFGERWQTDGELLDVVVGKIQDLQVNEVCEPGRDCLDLVVT